MFGQFHIESHYCSIFFQTVKNMDINPHAVEAWKATKSGVKGELKVD